MLHGGKISGKHQRTSGALPTIVLSAFLSDARSFAALGPHYDTQTSLPRVPVKPRQTLYNLVLTAAFAASTSRPWEISTIFNSMSESFLESREYVYGDKQADFMGWGNCRRSSLGSCTPVLPIRRGFRAARRVPTRLRSLRPPFEPVRGGRRNFFT